MFIRRTTVAEHDRVHAKQMANGLLARAMKRQKARATPPGKIPYELHYIKDPHTLERDHDRDPIIFYGYPGEDENDAFRREIKRRVDSNSHDLKDLSHLDLSLRDLTGMDISGLNISYSNISGTLFVSGTGENVNMTGTVGKSMGGQETSFMKFKSKGGIKAPNLHLEKADLRFSEIAGFFVRGGTFIECNGMGSFWVNPILTHTTQIKNNWSDSTHLNADRGNSVHLRNDFSRAVLDDDLKEAARRSLPRDAAFVPGERFPDKYRDAIFIGNTMDKSVLEGDNEMLKSAMRRDRVIHRLTSAPLLAAIVAIGVGVDMAFGAVESGLVEAALEHWKELGSAGLVLSVGWPIAANILPGKITDPISKHLESMAQSLTLKIATNRILKPKEWKRKAGQVEWGKTFQLALRPVCLMGDVAGLTPLLRALKATSKQQKGNPLFQTMKYVFTSDVRVVVCDHSHLAAALAHISVNRRRGYPMSRDITLVRTKAGASEPDAADTAMKGTPSTVTFLKNGTTKLTWDSGGEAHYAAIYDIDGIPYRQFDLTGEVPIELPIAQGLKEDAGELFQRLELFQEAILGDNELDDFGVCDESFVVQGKDGTILVLHKDTHELHNTKGPAIIPCIRPEDNKARLRKDKTRDPWPQKLYYVGGKHMPAEKFDEIYFKETDDADGPSEASVYPGSNISPVNLYGELMKQFTQATVGAASSNMKGWMNIKDAMTAGLKTSPTLTSLKTSAVDDDEDEMDLPSGPGR
jgi:hypothetical protein